MQRVQASHSPTDRAATNLLTEMAMAMVRHQTAMATRALTAGKVKSSARRHKVCSASRPIRVARKVTAIPTDRLHLMATEAEKAQRSTFSRNVVFKESFIRLLAGLTRFFPISNLVSERYS